MDAPIRDITMLQGATFFESRVLKLADPLFPDDRTKDTLMPLLGYSGRSSIKDKNGEGEVLATYTVTVDPVTSTVTRTMSAAQSTAISRRAKKLVHGLELFTENDLDVIRLEQGAVNMSWENS